MTESAEKTLPATFLVEENILPWETPLRPGEISLLHHYNASTKIKQYVGFEVFDERVGNYQVNASAVKYLADIARVPTEHHFIKDGKNTPMEGLLFIGGIQIYRVGMMPIPGTHIQGFDFKRNGKIWLARKQPVEPLGLARSQLARAMFGEVMSEEGVERILRGYEMQERKEVEIENRSR